MSKSTSTLSSLNLSYSAVATEFDMNQTNVSLDTLMGSQYNLPGVGVSISLGDLIGLYKFRINNLLLQPTFNIDCFSASSMFTNSTNLPSFDKANRYISFTTSNNNTYLNLGSIAFTPSTTVAFVIAVKFSVNELKTNMRIFQFATDATTLSNEVTMYLNATSNLVFQVRDNAGVSRVTLVSINPLSTNTVYLAVVRCIATSNAINFWLNGVSQSSTTTYTISDRTGNFRFGDVNLASSSQGLNGIIHQACIFQQNISSATIVSWT